MERRYQRWLNTPEELRDPENTDLFETKEFTAENLLGMTSNGRFPRHSTTTRKAPNAPQKSRKRPRSNMNGGRKRKTRRSY